MENFVDECLFYCPALKTEARHTGLHRFVLWSISLADRFTFHPDVLLRMTLRDRH